MLLTAVRPWSSTHPGAPPSSPPCCRAPSLALTRVEHLFVLEAPILGLGHSSRYASSSPGEGRRSGRHRPAVLWVWPFRSQCPRGHVPGTASPKAELSTRPGISQTSGLPLDPSSLLPSARCAFPTRSRAAADSPAPRAHAPSARPGALRPRAGAGGPWLSGERSRPLAARGPPPYVLPWAVYYNPRHPQVPSPRY
ncbi:hypothetical protein HJG60_010327 [Phyllostomus discolor]|uniref:Uncharacterized protein n=1 Tax=Phyllostomus discolor TaxID=89673 RepID=A0A834B2K2_9CHIR|nr:hypothetical protein HJG60_010327 [Phyllostomus discolor]